VGGGLGSVGLVPHAGEEEGHGVGRRGAEGDGQRNLLAVGKQLKREEGGKDDGQPQQQR
jgi:hypothetical protein